jgi:PBP1b-binding outer membrane lipoprotein LpoB
MRKILVIAATALFLVGCSSKTSEEKALDDAMKEFQETVGTVFGEMSPTITVSKKTA